LVQKGSIDDQIGGQLRVWLEMFRKAGMVCISGDAVSAARSPSFVWFFLGFRAFGVLAGKAGGGPPLCVVSSRRVVLREVAGR
jgi:hypothetical protein